MLSAVEFCIPFVVVGGLDRLIYSTSAQPFGDCNCMIKPNQTKIKLNKINTINLLHHTLIKPRLSYLLNFTESKIVRIKTSQIIE